VPLLLHNTALETPTPRDFRTILLDAARGGNLKRYLFIVPTGRRIQAVERETIAAYVNATGRPLERLPIVTLEGFVRDFHNRLQPIRRELTPGVHLALIYRAMQKADLSFFGGSAGTPSAAVAERIAHVLAGVRRDGIMPSDFKRDVAWLHDHPEAHGYNLEKLDDLYQIYSAYLELLNRSWSDHPGRMATLASLLQQDHSAIFRRAYNDVSQIYVYGFREFSTPETALLSRLAQVRDLEIVIHLDYEESNGPLYGNFSDAVSALTNARFRRTEIDRLEEQVDESTRKPFGHHMRRNLFRTDERIANASFDDLITLYSFHNREEEVQGICALIKRLVLNEGIAPQTLCVVTHNLEKYARLFAEHMAAYGIPAAIAQPSTLDRSGLMSALLAALAVPAGSYERRDVVRAISSPYLDFGPDVDPSAVVDAAAHLRIRRGRVAWERRIGQRLLFLKGRMAEIDDPDEQRGVQTEMESLERADRSVQVLADALDRFASRMTPDEFRRAFRRLLGRLGIADRILDVRRRLEQGARTPQDWNRVHNEIERDTRALSAALRMVDEMTEFFEVEYGPSSAFVNAPGRRRGDGRYSLEFYVDWLRTAAMQTRWSTREGHDQGVFIGTPGDIDGLDFNTVFVCGLIDGEFPGRYIPETFLGKPLPNAQDRQLRRERMEFYGAITAFERHLVLTCHRFAGATRIVRSSFIDALLRITTLENSGRVVDVDELRVVRARARSGADQGELLAPFGDISTFEGLAEEMGATLWSGGEIPEMASQQARDLAANLMHTVRVEGSRHGEESSRLPEYAGVIAEALDASERATLYERIGRNYSPSQLELYARCPFKYFARRLLRVVPTAEYDVTITPLERGLLLHSVLFRLYSELRDSDELPITSEKRDDVLARARELARQEIEGIVFDHPYWQIDQERLLGSDLLGGLLRRWIDYDIDRFAGGNTSLIPSFFEVDFGGGKGPRGGIDPTLSTAGPVTIHTVKFRGRVDRVEVARRGDRIYFAVADYKTGRAPTRADIHEGMSLQLMLYIEVIRRLLAEHFSLPLEDVQPVGAFYYQLDTRKVAADMKAVFVPNELKTSGARPEGLLRAARNSSDPETVDDLLALVDEVVARAEGYVEGIATGQFPLTTRDVNVVCRSCEFEPACRVRDVVQSACGPS